MNYDEELLRLLSLKWKDIKDNPTDVTIIRRIYAIENRSEPCCLSVLEAYYKNKKNKPIQKKITMQKAPLSENYELKDGLIMHSKKLGMHVSNKNLTDKISQVILEENPKRAANFVKMPTVEVKTDIPSAKAPVVNEQTPLKGFKKSGNKTKKKSGK